MSRLEAPLYHRTLWASGDVLLHGEIDLRMKTMAGAWQRETFRVDSGSEMTTMPAARARQLDLSMPPAPVPHAVHQPTALPFRSGFIRVQVVGMDQTEYVFPCFFLGDPDTPLNAGLPPALIPRNLLGLSGVIDKIEIRYNGKVTAHAAYGNLIVEKL